jgi:hypothetical protein
MNIRKKLEENVVNESQELNTDLLAELIEVQLDSVVGGLAIGYSEVSSGTYNRA